MTATLTPHPTNPHGIIVPCAECGNELHIPRAEVTEHGVDPANITCSYDCMTAHRAKDAA